MRQSWMDKPIVRKVLTLLLLAMVIVGVSQVSVIWPQQGAQDGSQLTVGRIVDGLPTIRIGSVAEAAGTCDFTVDGVNDDTELNLALAALPANGGRVQLLTFNYSINVAVVVTRAINNVTIEGVGRGTYVARNGALPVITAGGNNWVFTNLRTDAGGISMGATTGWQWSNVTVNATWYALRTSGSIESTVATGTAPFTVASTTKVSNLDADLVDGYQATRSATFVVAASDAGAASIAQADYVCDGAADQAQIQAAVNALPAMGGTVQLTEGTFALNDEVLITLPGVTIEGRVGFSQFSPKGTYIAQGNAAKPSFHFNPATRTSPYVLRRMTIVGGTEGVYSQRNTGSVVLEDLFFGTTSGSAIRFEDDGTGDPWTFTNIFLNRVEVETNGVWAAYFKQVGKTMNIIRITACHFVGGTIAGGGLYVNGASEFQMIGGMCENNAGYGMYIINSSGVTISGQKFYNWDDGGSGTRSALYLYNNNGVVINDNQFINAAVSKAAIESSTNPGFTSITGNTLTPQSGSLVAPVIAASGSKITWADNVGMGDPNKVIFTLSPDSTGWTAVPVAGGSVVANNEFIAVLRNAAVISSITRYHSVYGLNSPAASRVGIDFAKPLRIRVTLSIDQTDANRTCYFLIHEANTKGDLADRGLGLKVTGATVTGMGFNTLLGTTGTLATLTSGRATAFEMVLVPGLGLFFNVEGLPVAGIMTSTMFPSGESGNTAYVVESNETSVNLGSSTDFYVTNITFTQGWKN